MTSPTVVSSPANVNVAMSSTQSTPVQTPRIVQVIRSSRPLSRASSFAGSEHSSLNFGSVSSLPMVVSTSFGGNFRPQASVGVPASPVPSQKMMPSLLSSAARWDPKVGAYVTMPTIATQPALPTQAQSPVKVVVVRKRDAPLYQSQFLSQSQKSTQPLLPSEFRSPIPEDVPTVSHHSPTVSMVPPRLSEPQDDFHQEIPPSNASTPTTASTTTSAIIVTPPVVTTEDPTTPPAGATETGATVESPPSSAAAVKASTMPPLPSEMAAARAAAAAAKAAAAAAATAPAPIVTSDSDSAPAPAPAPAPPAASSSLSSTKARQVEFEGAGLGLDEDKREKTPEDEEEDRYWQELSSKITNHSHSHSAIDSDSDEEEEEEKEKEEEAEESDSTTSIAYTHEEEGRMEVYLNPTPKAIAWEDIPICSRFSALVLMAGFSLRHRMPRKFNMAMLFALVVVLFLRFRKAISSGASRLLRAQLEDSA
eukprot:CAMPEP_0206577800 /NCGR_PEP_ID=MMETSP0325_2-20121206/31581_1 /ASSEMBLY_ACC=CAM_ASM_000347 /TAXON_ID=2866 /ORGANISM="Crypthecodinium cohnii, Strain Seligo" /LENGTH=479 /DNA_ID=CAMNT_0054083313 /DNA_START=78 /DNA_END=1517 /DNA_ORIENTATION=-